MDNRRCVVNVSGGKDSAAMLLRMLELGQRVDEIAQRRLGAIEAVLI